MGSADIRAKIARGMKKAVNKTGSGSSDKVYLLQKTTTAGNPLNPGTVTTTPVELVNAVFTSYDKTLRDDNIKQGDRELVSPYDVEIKAGDTITQGAVRYLVIATDPVSPTSDVLVRKSQVRQQ